MSDQLTPEDVSWLDKFRNSVAEFRAAFDNLLANRAYVATRPRLQGEYTALFNRGAFIKNSVETITAAVDKVVGMASSAWDAVTDWFGFDAVPQRRGGLGVVPLLPIAAIAGAVALMGKWASDVYIFNKKIAEAKRLEGTGLSPQESALLSQGYGSHSLADTINSLKAPLVIGGILFLLYKYGDKIIPKGR